jgi:hypothetical protein
LEVLAGSRHGAPGAGELGPGVPPNGPAKIAGAGSTARP